jgi:hypothetical protein
MNFIIGDQLKLRIYQGICTPQNRKLYMSCWFCLISDDVVADTLIQVNFMGIRAELDPHREIL